MSLSCVPLGEIFNCLKPQFSCVKKEINQPRWIADKAFSTGSVLSTQG